MPNPVSPDSAWHSGFLCCITFCLLGTCLAGARVIQSPKHLIKAKGERSNLKCVPISGHSNVIWYQQVTGRGPQFLIQYYEKTVVDKGNMPSRFSAQQFGDYHSEMNMSALELGDSAVYLCASSFGTGSQNTLYFGAGTRLTVLEDLSQVKPPKVSVFEPSEVEISEKKKATLVCLARDFYPDHVELSWWVNGKEVRSGVSTDPQPRKARQNSSYTLSSRLRVSAAFWLNPRNHFRCQVQFYGLTEEDEWTQDWAKPVTQNISAETWGRADCGVTSASYHQGILSATILYEILLGKAALYAVLVSTLVLMTMVKKKSS